jgi:hypothetical protein
VFHKFLQQTEIKMQLTFSGSHKSGFLCINISNVWNKILGNFREPLSLVKSESYRRILADQVSIS